MGFFSDKYRAYKDAKDGRGTTFSDEDLIKHTGKSRAELDKWARSTEGVGPNQKAGSLTAGGTCGPAVGEYSTYDVASPLKFPPGKHQQQQHQQGEGSEQKEQQ
ncbi:hypothetical protein MN608_00685 [Microdochium nivale]|nr:hypothetical protein MN608_00685 [Microdochium nivale]